MPDLANQDRNQKLSGLNDTHATLAIEAAGLGLWEWDVAAEVMSVNDTLAEILGDPGLSAAPFPVAVLVELTHPDDRDIVSNATRDCISRGDGTFQIEHRLGPLGGEERWVWVRASVVESLPNGHARRVVGIVQDRTERKRVELELEREKKRNDLALAGSLIAIWEWDIASNQVRWSRYLSEILGLPADLLSGDRDFLNHRIHPDDVKPTRRATNDHLTQGKPYDVVFRLRHEAGHYITVRSRGQAQTNTAGDIVRIAGSIVDITKERTAEASARRLGLRSQLAVEAAELGTWELDLIAGKAVMDARLSELLGRPELTDTAIDGSAMLDFTAPEDRDVVRALFAALIKGESEFVHDQHRVLRADGHKVWIFAHVGVAERAVDGRALRLVGVTQDLSEQKSAERVLRTAKERAEGASQAKSNFLATMSHEIRTPLNGMLGVSQLLALSGLDDRQRRYVDTLQASGRMLSSVIDDILDISRIEAGKLSLKLESVDTPAWIEETLSPFHPMAAQKGLTLETTICDEARNARRFDPRRMAQVVANFVSNAIKFTEAGSITVSITTASFDGLRIEVTDTGPGVSEDKQDKIFDRFTQGDMSPRREHGGSGLGLAIARELTELASGKIGLNSIVGVGSTFWFEIPAPRALGAVTPDTLKPGPDRLISRRALIVEDNDVNRETLADMLQQNAITPQTVSSGEAALDRIAHDEFDMVLLDLHMPGMGGFEILHTIRNDAAYPNTIPVFLVSADATPEARAQAVSLGADGFITKPVDMKALIYALASVQTKTGTQ